MSALSIDLILTVLHRSAFDPFLPWLLPLSLRALATPYAARSFQLATLYAALVSLAHVLHRLDRRLAHGRPPRPVDWESEVVLITGGAGGVGGLLAEVYGLRGAAVAVADVAEEEEMRREWEEKGVLYYRCDVGRREEVEGLKGRVERDLGPVTVLINNAAVASAKPLLALSEEEVERTCRTNLLSNFHTLHAFLPGMLARPAGGTVVTVSSVLGSLGCAALSAYTATKAAQTALHHSLVAELPRGSQVRALLLTPGQLSTRMFARVRPPSSFLGPVVEASSLAAAVVEAVDAGVGGEIALPLYARWIGVLAVLPAGLRTVVRRWAGLDDAAWRAFSGELEADEAGDERRWRKKAE